MEYSEALNTVLTFIGMAMEEKDLCFGRLIGLEELKRVTRKAIGRGEKSQ